MDIASLVHQTPAAENFLSPRETFPESPISHPSFPAHKAPVLPSMDQLTKFVFRPHNPLPTKPSARHELMGPKLPIPAMMRKRQSFYSECALSVSHNENISLTFTVPEMLPVNAIVEADKYDHHEFCGNASSIGGNTSASASQGRAQNKKLKEKVFDCSQCDSKFAVKSNLLRHVTMVHEKLKPFDCELCSMKFVQKSGLKRHMVRAHS